jgi:hypothetical protein
VGASCDAPAQYGDINVTSQIEASDGLDLRAVGALVKEAESAQDLERRLNREGGINNLDLNADGKVDFIHVTEYGGEQAKGFSLTVQPAEGETQEVATIEIEKSASEAGAGEPAQQKADVYVRGNDQIYGSQHHHYHSSYPIGSMLLMAYLFRPHPFYVSPFGFGYYPPYYGGGYSRVSRTTYATRAAGAAAGSTPRAVSGRASSLRSPNAGKRHTLQNSTADRSPLAAPDVSPRPTAKGLTRRRGEYHVCMQ